MVNGSRNNGGGGIFTRFSRLALEPREKEFYDSFGSGGRPPRSPAQKERQLKRLRAQHDRARLVGLGEEANRIAAAYRELSGVPIDATTSSERQAAARQAAARSAAVESIDLSDLDEDFSDLDDDFSLDFSPNPSSVGIDPDVAEEIRSDLRRTFAGMSAEPQPVTREAERPVGYGGSGQDPYRPNHPYNAFGYCTPGYDQGRGG